MQHEKELFTLRFNRMNSVRVEPHGWSKVLCHLNSNLSYLQSIFVQPAHNKMLDRAQIGWRKGNPSDQALPPPKVETEHRQVVEDTSEEEAGAL